MKNAIFQLKRNDVFTLITNLRKFVKAHDRAMSETSDYQMIQNSELTITLRIGEQKTKFTTDNIKKVMEI